jgi:hypothetical protein
MDGSLRYLNNLFTYYTPSGRFRPVLWSRNFFFRSGSDFQKVSAPAPARAPATALELPVITDFMLNRTFFMFLIKENRPNSHAKS